MTPTAKTDTTSPNPIGLQSKQSEIQVGHQSARQHTPLPSNQPGLNRVSNVFAESRTSTPHTFQPASHQIHSGGATPQPERLQEWMIAHGPTDACSKIWAYYSYVKSRASGLEPEALTEGKDGWSDKVCEAITRNIKDFCELQCQIEIDAISEPSVYRHTIKQHWDTIETGQQVRDCIEHFREKYLEPMAWKMAKAADIAILRGQSIGQAIDQVADRLDQEFDSRQTESQPTYEQVLRSEFRQIFRNMFKMAAKVPGTYLFNYYSLMRIGIHHELQPFRSDFGDQIGLIDEKMADVYSALSGIDHGVEAKTANNLYGNVIKPILKELNEFWETYPCDCKEVIIWPTSIQHLVREEVNPDRFVINQHLHEVRLICAYLSSLVKEKVQWSSLDPGLAPDASSVQRAINEHIEHARNAQLKFDLRIAKAAECSDKEISVITQHWQSIGTYYGMSLLSQGPVLSSCVKIASHLASAAESAIKEKASPDLAVDQALKRISEELEREETGYVQIQSRILISAIAKMIKIAAHSGKDISITPLEQALIATLPVFGHFSEANNVDFQQQIASAIEEIDIDRFPEKQADTPLLSDDCSSATLYENYLAPADEMRFQILSRLLERGGEILEDHILP